MDLPPADDLTRITGIDERVAAQLRAGGVRNYQDLADMSAKDMARIADALELGKSPQRNNWVEQAQILARGGLTAYARQRDRETQAQGERAAAPRAPAPAAEQRGLEDLRRAADRASFDYLQEEAAPAADGPVSPEPDPMDDLLVRMRQAIDDSDRAAAKERQLASPQPEPIPPAAPPATQSARPAPPPRPSSTDDDDLDAVLANYRQRPPRRAATDSPRTHVQLPTEEPSIQELRRQALEAAAPKPPAPAPAPARTGSDLVDCSVFSPARVSPGEAFKVQAHLHVPSQLAQALRTAARIDPSANLQSSRSLSQTIPRGTEIELCLTAPGLVIARPFHTLTWQGAATNLVFDVEMPRDFAAARATLTLYLALEGIPLGDVSFSLEISAVRAEPPRNAETVGAAYRSAFVSYSRKDFREVSLFAQGLTQNDVNLCLDVTALEPGQEWAAQLPQMLRKADVFYLMWSDNAATSRWVDWEARQAVTLYDGPGSGRPRIVPITLHRPAPKPPDYLGRFHFDSPWLAQRTAHMMPLFRPPPA